MESLKEAIGKCADDEALQKLHAMCECATLTDSPEDRALWPLTAQQHSEDTGFNACTECGRANEAVCACP